MCNNDRNTHICLDACIPWGANVFSFFSVFFLTLIVWIDTNVVFLIEVKIVHAESECIVLELAMKLDTLFHMGIARKLTHNRTINFYTIWKKKIQSRRLLHTQLIAVHNGIVVILLCASERSQWESEGLDTRNHKIWMSASTYQTVTIQRCLSTSNNTFSCYWISFQWLYLEMLVFW